MLGLPGDVSCWGPQVLQPFPLACSQIRIGATCGRRTDVSGMRSWLLNRRSVSADSWKTFSFSSKGSSVVHEISMIRNPALASTSGHASYFIRLVQQWDSIILVLLPFSHYSHWEFLCSAGIFISKLSSWWNMPDSYTRNLFICGISSL